MSPCNPHQLSDADIIEVAQMLQIAKEHHDEYGAASTQSCNNLNPEERRIYDAFTSEANRLTGKEMFSNGFRHF